MHRGGMALACGAVLSGSLLQVTSTVAAMPPRPVSAVSVTGTSTPLEALIAWSAPADPTYAGARIVVVPGATPTADPQDARAVFRSDIAATASSTTWLGQEGQVYAVSVFGYDAAQTSWSPPVSSLVRMPGRASHIAVDNYRNRIFTAFWVLEPGSDEAVLCFRRGAAPATIAEAEACSAPGRYLASFEPGGTGFWTDPPTALGQFAVFGRSSTTGLLAPGATDTGETPPPFPPTDLQTEAVTGTKIRLRWQGPSWLMGGYPTNRAGGQTHWLLYQARGGVPPAQSPGAALIAEVPVGGEEPLEFLATGLEPGRIYSFALRGRDAEGNLSDWGNVRTTRAREPGLLVLHDRAGGSRWRAARVPGRPATDEASLIVTRSSGAAHVVYGGAEQRLHHAVLRSGDRWARGSVPPRSAYAQDVTVGPDGELAAFVWARRPCVVVRRPTGWRPVRCLSDAANDGQLEVLYDRAGRLHVLYATWSNGLRYTSNAGGSWRDSAVSPGGGRALLAYDVATDSLVLVREGEAGSVLVTTKRADAQRFGPPRTWVGKGRAVEQTAITSRGGRVTVVGQVADGDSMVPVIITGPVTGPARLAAVRGAGGGDSPQLAAMSRDKLVLAWTKFGAWSSQVLWDAGGQRWRMTTPVRRTRSPYDQLLGVEVDRSGNTYLLVHRRSFD